MSKIDDKWDYLKAQGVDLGHPLGPEVDAAAGGRFRRYEHGNIYCDTVMRSEAHEVHGGILSLYLAHGGPGANPATGGRGLGYPLSDEVRAGEVPWQLFEWGAIYWTPVTDGCVVSGGIYQLYIQHPENGLPLTSNTPVDGGEVVDFEGGVIFRRRQRRSGARLR